MQTENTYSNKSRVGNFTSSEIAALMTDGRKAGEIGAPAKTYIAECNMERRLQRPLEKESNARPLSWGNHCEKRVFDILPLDYKLMGSETIDHPTIEYWKGSPDAEKHVGEKAVIDVKCPITMKSFCQLVDPLYEGLTGREAMLKIRDTHKDGDKYFWQIVSNAILTNSKFGELIVYCPYESELEEIQLATQMYEQDQAYKFMWINYARKEELPWLPDGGYYKNINIIRFEITDAEKMLLTNRVLFAGKSLIKIDK